MWTEIINEGGNSVLLKIGAKAPLGSSIKAHLLKTKDKYEGKIASKGLQRLINVLSMDRDSGGIGYNELTQLKHVFSKMNKSDEEYEIIGGDLMKSWVEVSLASMENSVKLDKEARRRAGEQNVYRKTHTKDTSIRLKPLDLNESEFVVDHTDRVFRISETQANYIKN